MTVDVGLYHRPEIVCQISPRQSCCFVSTFHLAFFGSKSLHTVKEQGLILPLSQHGVMIKTHCWGDLCPLFHLFIYSVICLYQCELMNVYFILWVRIQYYFILLHKFSFFGHCKLFLLAPMPFGILHQSVGFYFLLFKILLVCF